MDRITAVKGDIVYLKKDGELIAPANMSKQEIRVVMCRLALYEEVMAWAMPELAHELEYALFSESFYGKKSDKESSAISDMVIAPITKNSDGLYEVADVRPIYRKGQ